MGVIMEKGILELFQFCCRIALLPIILSDTTLSGATQVVQFGGGFGFAYSLSSFNANVGDTVQWTGDFGIDPLSSTSVPTGAATWHYAGPASAFIYPIRVVGSYAYRSDVHADAGMVGSFTVNAVGVLENTGIPAANHYGDLNVEIAAGNGKSIVKFNLARSEFVTLRIVDLHGRIKATLLKETLFAGRHELMVDKAVQGKGLFLLVFTCNGTQTVRSHPVF